MAFLLVEIGLFAILAMMLVEQDVSALGGNIAFITISIIIGFLGTGYVLGETALERYIAVAQLATHGHDSDANPKKWPAPDKVKME